MVLSNFDNLVARSMQTTCTQNHKLCPEPQRETSTASFAQLRVRIDGEARLFHRSVALALGCSCGWTSPQLVALVHSLNVAVARANAHDALNQAEQSTADKARKDELEEMSSAICEVRSNLEAQIRQAPINSIADLVVLAKLAEHQHVYGQMDDEMPVLLVDTILRMFAGRGFAQDADGKYADRPIELGDHVVASPDAVANWDDLMRSSAALEDDETYFIRRITYLNHLTFIDTSKLSPAMARLWSEIYERDRIDEVLVSAEDHVADNERLHRIWEVTHDKNFGRRKELVRKIVALSPQTAGDIALQSLLVWYEYQGGTPNYACAAIAAERALAYAGMLPAPVVSQREGNAPNNFATFYEVCLAP